MNHHRQPHHHVGGPRPDASRRRRPTGRGPSPVPWARRGGWNLVELLVVLAILSVLLGTVGIVAQRMMRHGSQLAVRANQQASLARLARQFRRDVHASQWVTVPSHGERTPGVVAIDCAAADGTVFDYRLRRGRVVRIERRGDRRIGRETFDVPRGCLMRLNVSGDAPRRLASLRIAWTTDAVALPRGTEQTRRDQQFVIDAIIGRDDRWTDRPPSEPPHANRSQPDGARE